MESEPCVVRIQPTPVRQGLAARRKAMVPCPSTVAFIVAIMHMRGAVALTDAQHGAALPLPDGSFLSIDGELPGPNLDDGTPTKLYSLSLGRLWHNHTASAELTAAVESKKVARRHWQGQRSLFLHFEDTPLFPGWGTHFAYVYAGTPAQRVSVIIDTGSHFTAFPCSECKNCGSHTDPHWDHTKSSTSKIVSCEDCHGSFRCQKNKRCGFSQRYSEGSSWSAYQVEDVLWVGELTLEDAEKLHHDESAYSVDFMFGCIESQTGLFKTQLADGIMGMSADSHTLVWQLHQAGKIKERTFSLCFGLTGGTMVIGGYDTRLNKRGQKMEYTTSTKSSGWFTVKVLDITLNGHSIESEPSVYQRGKGIIVDSGTTDTYLPKSVANGFSKAWQATTGNPYKTCMDNHFCMTLTPLELEALPTLTVHMDGGLEVHVRPEAYMDALGKDNAYAPRIYLTESMGGVLGANVMRDHNVVFDYDNRRVGFAEGVCDYKADELDVDAESDSGEGGEPKVSVEGPGEGAKGGEENVDCVTAKERVKKCDVTCPLGSPFVQSLKGHEEWVDVVVTHAKGTGKACPEHLEEELRGCVKECPAGASNPSENGKSGAAGDAPEGDEGKELEEVETPEAVVPETHCSLEEEVWTPCSADCLQERFMGESCDKEAEVRPCHVGDHCPMSKAGLLLSMGITLTIDIGSDGGESNAPDLWLQWIGTAVADATATQLKDVHAGNVVVLISAIDPDVGDIAQLPAVSSVACTAEVEMHLTPKVDNAAADRVSQVVNLASFPETLTSVLAAATRRHWLLPGVTVTVLTAEKISMFVASNREPYLPPESNRLQRATPGSGNLESPHGLLIGGALVVLAIAGLVFRVKTLRPEGQGFQAVSQVEMSAREGRLGDVDANVVLDGASGGRSLRRTVGVARDSA